MMRTGAVALVMLCCAGALHAQQAADSAGTLHTLRVNAAPVIRVELERGDVLVRAADAGVLHVRSRALSPERAARTAQPLVTMREAEGVIDIVATAAGRLAGAALVLDLPPGAALEISLARGDIRAEGVTGTYSLQTARGDVELLQHSGSAVVDVRNGNVRASFRALDAQLPSAFTTLNGNVDLMLPSSAATDLDVRCRGCTLRDIPRDRGVQVTRILTPPDGDPVLALHGVLGGGGPALRVFTWNGEVSVRVH